MNPIGLFLFLLVPSLCLFPRLRFYVGFCFTLSAPGAVGKFYCLCVVCVEEDLMFVWYSRGCMHSLVVNTLIPAMTRGSSPRPVI